ncbi:hypothetical protein Zmor_000028 [Zophobas morio]|uniref:Uncharacterized protein n=1 Tax=Zophobas morio TaxID=2755281 RepID=A0AA38IYK7_9CUCU|nr:hypothetical protein Zmor_000028 [Zophobas morio]
MFYMDRFATSKIRKAPFGRVITRDFNLLEGPQFFLFRRETSAEIPWGNVCRVRPQVLSQLLQPLPTTDPPRCTSMHKYR